MNKKNKIMKLSPEMMRVVALLKQDAKLQGTSILNSKGQWLGRMSLKTLDALQRRKIITVAVHERTTTNRETGKMVTFTRASYVLNLEGL